MHALARAVYRNYKRDSSEAGGVHNVQATQLHAFVLDPLSWPLIARSIEA
jgi:hypothetical protein